MIHIIILSNILKIIPNDFNNVITIFANSFSDKEKSISLPTPNANKTNTINAISVF